MMETYTFRLQVANKTNVTGEVRDPQQQLLENPSGKFVFSGKLRTQTLALAESVRQGTASGAELRKLGDLLFKALFNDQIKGKFFDYYEKARGENALLRLELEVDERAVAPKVAALPWEFLHVSAEHGHGDFWIGTNPVLVFSRQRARLNLPKPLKLLAGEKLRVALAVAAPKDKTTPYEEFWQELQTLADEQKERFELLPLVNPATTGALDDLLEKKPHVLHFIGHGDLTLDGREEQGFVHLVDETGYAIPRSGYEFAELFVRHRPGIVVLQVCEGGALSAAQAFAGVASQVVDQNIPVVIAMQYLVSNATARRFGREFYRRLAQDEAVDKAVQEGRREIGTSASGYQKRDFATPVLFMRVQDAMVFQRDGAAQSQPQPQTGTDGDGGGGGGPWDWVITVTQYTRELRNALAGLYTTRADVERLAQDAGLDPRRLRDDSNPTNRMMFLLDEARNQGILTALVKAALNEYGGNPKLSEALRAMPEEMLERAKTSTSGSPVLMSPPVDWPVDPNREVKPWVRDPSEWSFGEKVSVVNALLECPSIRGRGTRDAVVSSLHPYIRDNIERSDVARADVLAILDTCLNYKDGLADLVERIEAFDGGTKQMQNLKSTLRKLGAL